MVRAFHRGTATRIVRASLLLYAALFWYTHKITVSMIVANNSRLKQQKDGSRSGNGPLPIAPESAPASAHSHQASFVLPSDDPLLKSHEWDMSPIVIEQYKLIFFTQPKVGCTVFKQLFRRMMGYIDWKLENCCQYLPWNPATNGLTYLSQYDAETASRMLRDPTYTKAIFVRDPVTRFLSAYLDKAVQNPYFLHQKCGQEYPQKGQALSMQDFYDLIKRCENPHWRPQSQRLPRPEYWELITFVGHMETVCEDTERLLRRLGAWEPWGTTGWGENGEQAIFEGSTGRHHATSAVTKREQYVSPELERLLQTEFYASDYRLPFFRRYNRSAF